MTALSKSSEPGREIEPTKGDGKSKPVGVPDERQDSWVVFDRIREGSALSAGSNDLTDGKHKGDPL